VGGLASAVVGPERGAEDEDDEAAVRRVAEYYEAAGPDYAAWSPAFNMHFGFFRRGMSPWRLAPQLEQMNAEVLGRLGLASDRVVRVLDLGCGLGEVARYVARQLPLAEVTGLTIAPGQVARGERMTAAAGLERRVKLVLADYRRAPVADRSVDAAYAVESFCHARGAGRAECVRELRRVLRAGGRFVVADGFIKHGGALPGWLEPVRRRVCAGWAIEGFAELPAFVATLREHGFVDVAVEEVFWPVVPSALHVPATAARFLLRERLRGPLGALRLGNALAPVYGLALGLARRHFAYHFVTGRAG
jgi:SAM-dependent methyltransferase